ncbi:MAG TPA: response regulator transcription factor [Solirubrobacteraceae bacterium]|nr:response regulator transcription factor [Solirubrobacteraceae bacterium]
MIRILLADDHHVVRAGLKQLLETAGDMEVVAMAANGRDAVEQAEKTTPDVVLMDLSMPELDGSAATRQLLGIAPASRVVVLTSFSDRDRILDALDAGAVGYLLKDAEPDELINGIRAAARGESPLHPKAASTLLSARTGDRAQPLSDRERDVLQLVATGMPNKLIASRLEISEKTVKKHLTSIYQQIGVSDRTQAALWAQRNGFAQRQERSRG